jgi:hypothetical protein
MSSQVFQRRRNVTGHPIPEVVLRTRRSVMEAANELQAQRTRKRRHVGIALLAMGALVFFFAPALWSAVSDLNSGEHFLDLPVLVLTLFVVFLSAVFAILLVTLRDRAARDEQR